MSFAVDRAAQHIRRVVPGAKVSPVGGKIFVRYHGAESAIKTLDGDKVAGRVLRVNSDNRNTTATVVTPEI